MSYPIPGSNVPHFGPTTKKVYAPMLHYKVYTYDVWGNARDGWEVNNVFFDSTLDIPKVKMDGSAKELFAYLRKINFLNYRFKSSLVSIDGESDYTLYFTYKDKPVFELRREK